MQIHHHVKRELRKIEVHAHPDNELVTIKSVPPVFSDIGRGTDAIVVTHPHFPQFAFKVYARERLYKKESERDVYKRLGNSRYFARCYGSGDGYLILSYEEGPTLYECLERGILIPERVIDDVARAKEYVRRRGLNPRDIHLKNVLLQNGRAKLIDVSEYQTPGDDKRWEHLVQAYYDYYPLIRGRMVPDWFMDRIKKFYLRQADRRFSLSQFAQTVTRSAGWNPNVKTGQAERGIDMFQNPTDEQRAKLLKEAKTIAVVGCSDNPERTSYLIAEALQRAGYRIIPVNPNLTRPVLGEKPYASLTEIDEPIDIVNVFRRSEAVLPIAKEAVEVGTKGIWMQLGVVNEEAARLAQENGLMVIMDRCIKVDHAILLGKKA